ncbi:ABC transporter substrate-binding protein [Planotetraspora kaengkrachanensis]|uniref:Glycine/betaine ABC transporter substrate-binding protein n=1 Tax=Planotetraspora kaengkrachanensis TaxID=575193 RepID=A0A8J3Q1A8_9ACTN|nr:ABC transporter substrate-binding protein [Planotetraspora kaengkrachanensis]GIG84743.1 glycine/betaine ABC transporter substrate-binding protein [Planotetraspora kaengkrachanensis]
MKRILTAAVVAVTAALTLSACGGSDPLTSATPSNAPASSGGTSAKVVVGSFNFPESILLGSIYAQALQAKGVTVEEKPNIGTREVVYDQVKSGGLTVVPEYIGSLLAFVDKTSTAKTKDEIVAGLQAKLPAELGVLDPSEAQDNNSLTVTKDTAAKDKLTTIEDLAKVSKNFVVGGPPEFKERQEQNFKDVYGMEFKEWKPTGDTTADAIKSGTIQVGNVFTTDPKIVLNDLVSLQDTKNAFGSDNVTPLVYKAGVDDTVTSTLNAVSAKLTTDTLLSLMKQISVDKADPPVVAKDWLTQNGLL